MGIFTNENNYILYTITNTLNNNQYLGVANTLTQAKREIKDRYDIEKYELNDLMIYEMLAYGYDNFEFNVLQSFDNSERVIVDEAQAKELTSENYVYNDNGSTFINDSVTKQPIFYEAKRHDQLWEETQATPMYKELKAIVDKWHKDAQGAGVNTNSLSLSVIKKANNELGIKDLEDLI